MVEERNDLERRSDEDLSANREESGPLKLSENKDPESPNEIKERIEETRSQMGETIDAIQDRLSFSNLSEQVTEHVNHAVDTAKEAVYDATIGKAATIMKNISEELSGNSVVQTVKNNPLPFVLIGAGAGLLLYQNYNGKKGTSRHRIDLEGRDRSTRQGADTGSSLSDKANGLADSVTDVAGGAYDKVTGVVSSAYSGAGEAVSHAYEKAGQLGHSVRESYDTYIEDNPLAVGAVALAMGAAVGLAIPSTSYEGQVFGTARQKLMDSAETTATNLIDRTKEAVTEAGRNIADQVTLDTEH